MIYKKFEENFIRGQKFLGRKMDIINVDAKRKEKKLQYRKNRQKVWC